MDLKFIRDERRFDDFGWMYLVAIYWYPAGRRYVAIPYN